MHTLHIDNFTTLNPSVLHHESHTIDATGIDPSLIILCMFTNATSKVVSKYANDYISQFSNSSILLLITDTSDILLTSSSQLDKRLQPAVEIILRHDAYSKEHIGAAIYSNGGALLACALAKAYRNRLTDRPLPVDNVIFDSAPGSDSLVVGHRIIFAGLPSIMTRRFPPLSVLVSAVLWVVLLAYIALFYLVKRTGPITIIRGELNDPTLFAVRAQGKQRGVEGRGYRKYRTYIYSEKDIVVPFRAVEASALEAKDKGWNIKLEKFDGSAHVAHSLIDRERYWGLVKNALQNITSLACEFSEFYFDGSRTYDGRIA
jgi:hypothetical protein